MLILAIETTAITASVALVLDSRIISSFTVNNKLTHSQKLLPMIDNVLLQSGYKIRDIELICASAGPGSFTGVRIGISTVKGLAFANDTPCVVVSSLEALAYQNRYQNAVICPLMDARRDEYYNALFCENMTRISSDRAISAQMLENELSKYERVILNGDGAKKFFEYLDKRLDNVMLSSEFTLLQNAAAVGILAYEKYQESGAVSSFEIAPLYLRKPQAEREYKESKVKIENKKDEN